MTVPVFLLFLVDVDVDFDIDFDGDINVDDFPPYTLFPSPPPPSIYPRADQHPSSTLTSHILIFSI